MRTTLHDFLENTIKRLSDACSFLYDSEAYKAKCNVYRINPISFNIMHLSTTIKTNQIRNHIFSQTIYCLVHKLHNPQCKPKLLTT